MKTEIAVVFGGISSEHEISVISAKSIVQHLDPSRYQVHLVGIHSSGVMTLLDPSQFSQIKTVPSAENSLYFVSRNGSKGFIYMNEFQQIDVVFPVLHGAGGKDGWMQGYFDTLRIPYVGSNVEGSCIGMNKYVSKILLHNTFVQQVPYANFFSDSSLAEIKSNILENFVFPVFIKPVHGGSSIGISKCKKPEDLDQAILLAFEHDREIIAEQSINGREIECSVLGDYENVKSSLPGEIIPKREFYDYEAKYIEDSTRLVIPAQLPSLAISQIQEQALFIFKQLRCYGMARVDFFLEKDSHRLFFNEINTIPGFTEISMYPKLWEATGLSYSALIEELIRLAIQRRISYKYG